MQKDLKININIFILPLLNILMFIVLSSFGQTFSFGIGLSFIFSLMFLLIYVINYKFIPLKINFPFLILLLYTLIRSLVAMDLYYGIISIGTISSFSLLVNLKMTNDNWKKSFIITSVFSTIVLILYNYKYILVNWNPNSMGIFCSLGMMMSIMALFLEKKKKNKILIFMFCIFQVLQLYLTGCRTSTFIFIISLLFSFYYTIVSNNKKSKSFIVYLILCLSFTLLATQYMKLANSNYLNWLIEISKNLFNKATLFSDRETIWKICDYLSQDFWFFGCGKSLYHILYAHNMYYSIQYTFGFFGYILFSFFILSTCNYIHKNSNSKLSLISIIIFSSLLLGQITENTMFTSDSSIFMPYLYLSIGISTLNKLEMKL